MLVGRPVRRLPGVRFEVQAPPLPEVLPRMDVAAFVGFAASGPRDVPVVVEDADGFAAIFGSDATLAWDAEGGAWQRAHLAPAVRAFFKNGGQRAWVVRVAGAGASANRFPVPGLVAVDGSGARPAYARARSEGSWSDALAVSATLDARPVALARGPAAASPPDDSLELRLASAGDVVPGDLLRLRWPDEGLELYYAVETVTAVVPATQLERDLDRFTTVRVTPFAQRWTTTRAPASPTTPIAVHGYTADGDGALFVADDPPAWSDDGTITLRLDCDEADAPPPGAALSFAQADGVEWLSVISVAGDGDGDHVRVTARGRRLLANPPALPSSPPIVERLSFELWVAEGDGAPTRLDELGFRAPHPRFFGALPDDVKFFSPPAPGDQTADTYADLWAAAGTPRFPLAGGGGGALYLPLAMPELVDAYLGAELPVAPGSPPQPASALERDGLAVLDASLFVDGALAEVQADAIASEADFIRYQSTAPRPLTGLHALLAVDEVSLVAVPDAIHAGFVAATTAPPAPPAPRDEPDAPPSSAFVDCRPPPPAAPSLSVERLGDAYSLAWTLSPPRDGASFILVEATRPDLSDAVEIFDGAGASRTLYGRAASDYYYRVRAFADGQLGPWSPAVVVRVGGLGPWRVSHDAAAATALALSVHRALLRMCAARGDLFAVLALPDGTREADAVDYVTTLKSVSAAAPAPPALLIPPFTTAEASVLSYGAIYHPWIWRLEDEGVRPSPPDGAMLGVLARRTVDRGAWIAPANEPLTDVVATDPPVQREQLGLLQEAQVNAIRQETRGFLTLAADTLCDDPSLWPIQVRRLLQLLRRVALREGAKWVFEPNSDAFRRLVKRSFELLLADLYRRGAFDGATPDAAFRVNVGGSDNRPAAVEAGRFVVELMVAPAQALEFLTVRLVQTADQGLVTEGA